MKITLFPHALIAAMVLMVGLAGRASADIEVYATASSGGDSNSILGTLDLTTGQFTQTASLSQQIVSLTSGAGGTLYAGAIDGLLYTVGAGGSTQFGSVLAPLPPGDLQQGFFGLAYAGRAGFYAVDESSGRSLFYQVGADGNSVNQIGAPLSVAYPSGALAFGQDGVLHADGAKTRTVHQFYSIDPASGVATSIGTGLGTTDFLTLVTADGQLYGIDTSQSNVRPINIYTINTATGVATATGVVVSGVANGYTLDTAAAVSVPEPSTLNVALAGLAAGLCVWWRQRRRGWGRIAGLS